MRAARFLTICFLYSGLVLLAQYTLVYDLQLSLENITQLGLALCFFGTGLIRLRYSETEEQRPTKFGVTTYGMAILSLFLTAIVALQLILS